MYVYAAHNHSGNSGIVNSPVSEWKAEIDKDGMTMFAFADKSVGNDFISMTITDCEQAEWIIRKLEAFVTERQIAIAVNGE